MESAHVEPNLMGPSYESLQHFATGVQTDPSQLGVQAPVSLRVAGSAILQIMLHLDEDYLEVC